jgi:hypothetical protein
VRLRGGVGGLDGLNAALAEIGRAGVLDEALAATAEDIRQRAAARLDDGAPPDGSSGALAESLSVVRDGDGGFAVATPLDHGWHLEFGSATRAAMPWLTPAAEDARPGLAERAKDDLNAVIADAVRRQR